MIKKKACIWIICGLVGFLSGCIKEDREHCAEDYSYALSFIYYGNGNTDIFPSRMETVRVYVFDTDGSPVGQYVRSKSQLQELQGIPLDLQPGQYQAICWSNVTDLSEITGEGESAEDHYLYSRPWLRNEAIVNFDSLYYGKETFVVPDRRDGSDTVYFRSAHIRMNVFVRGLSSTRAVNDPEGWLEVRNVFTGYDFDGNLTGEISNMYPAWTGDDGMNTLQADFDLFRFKNRNAIVIDLYNGERERVYSLDLTTFLAENSIDVEGVDEVTVPIYIRFTGTNVHISVEGWGSEGVEPIT